MLSLAPARTPLAGLALIGAGFVAYAVYLGWGETIDDAAISFAYAKHLVEGDGLVLSRGAEPVEAYSNFLWLLVMVPVIAVGLDVIVSAKVIGLLLSLATLLLLARIPSQVEGRGTGWSDLLAPALTAVALPFALWAVSGMESALQAFLLVLVVALSIRELNDERALPWSSLAFFALAITRPEGIVFLIAAVAHRGLLMLLGRRPGVRDVQWLAGFLVPFVIYHIWHYQYFGELVPNTYFAKAEQRSVTELFTYVTSSSDPGFDYVWSFVKSYWLLPILPLLAVSLLGARQLRAYSLPLLMLIAGVASALFVGGDWMEYHRFLAPLIPLLYLGVQEGVRNGLPYVRRLVGGGDAFRWQTYAGGAIALAILALAASASATKAEAAHDRPFGAPYSIIRLHGESLQQLAQRLELERLVVLTPDIGAVALNTDISIIDLGGLGDAFIARHKFGPGLDDYVFGQRRPDVIAFHGVWVRTTGLADDPRFWINYSPISLELNDGGQLAAGTFVRSDLVHVSGACADAVPWALASSLVGQRATFAGLVTGSSSVGTPEPATLLHTAGPVGPVIVVRDRDVANFAVPPAGAYSAKAVCVTGSVQTLDGEPVVYASTSDDIVLDESARIWTLLSGPDSLAAAPPDASPGEIEALSALQRGELWGEDLRAELVRYGVDFLVVAESSLAFHALGDVTAFAAEDMIARDGAPELVRQDEAAGGSYWAFTATERQRVGGGRFTVPGDFDLKDDRLGFVIEVAPSTPVVGDQAVRVVVSYWQAGQEQNDDVPVFNAVSDIVLRDSTGAGAVVRWPRLPQTEFAAGETYDFNVWRSPDATEDSYPDDLWFSGVRVVSSSDAMERITGTRVYVHPVAP